MKDILQKINELKSSEFLAVYDKIAPDKHFKNAEEALSFLFQDFIDKGDKNPQALIDYPKEFPEWLPVGSLIANEECRDGDIAKFLAEKNIPAFINIAERAGVFIESDENKNGLLENFLLKIVFQTGVNNTKIDLIDPEERGRSLPHLLSCMPRERLNVITRDTEMAKLSEQIEDEIINVGRLTNLPLYEYNKNQYQKHPYHFIVIPKIENIFEDEASKKHISRLIGGIGKPSINSGVYFFITGNDISLAQNNSDLFYEISLKEDQKDIQPAPYWSGLDEDFLDIKFVGDGIDAYNRQIVDFIKNKALGAESKTVYGIDILNNTKLWQGNSTDGVSMDVGIRNDGQVFGIRIDNSVFNALIGGASGSGKTVLLHALILSLAKKYSPEEVELILMDYKEGTEFLPYAKLPHIKAISLGNKVKFGIDILNYLTREIERRGSLFKEAGVSNYKSYRDAAGAKLPRIVVIIDEFQRLFNDEYSGINAKYDLEDIIRRGRSFGINVILSSQSLMDAPLTQATLQQIMLRVCLKLTADESARFLTGKNLAPSNFTKPGQALANYDFGSENSNEMFNVALFKNEEIKAFVKELEAEETNSAAEKYFYLNDDPVDLDEAKKYIKENEIALSYLNGIPPSVEKIRPSKKNKIFICADDANQEKLDEYIDLIREQYKAHGFEVENKDAAAEVLKEMADPQKVFFMKLDEDTEIQDLNNAYYDDKSLIKSNFIIYTASPQLYSQIRDIRRDFTLKIYLDSIAMRKCDVRTRTPIDSNSIILDDNTDIIKVATILKRK